MKDLILISSYCNTPTKEDILRNLVDQIHQNNHFDLMIVSHLPIPVDISSKTNYTFYDYKNELLYDWDLRSTPWFDPGDYLNPILSIFTGFYNTHLTIWRMLILGNSLAKNLGYTKVHHIEYDASISNFTELYDNSKLLDTYDCITYNKKEGTVSDILFGSYQAYRLDTIDKSLLNLDENQIKNSIRESSEKSPEGMLFDLLHQNKNGLVKNKHVLDLHNNLFGISNSKVVNDHTAWCLPYYDNFTKELGFVIWNMEQDSKDINIKLLYNDQQVIDLGNVPPNHWKLHTLGPYSESNTLIVLLNNKIRNTFDFNQYREEFKKFSYRKNKING